MKHPRQQWIEDLIQWGYKHYRPIEEIARIIFEEWSKGGEPTTPPDGGT